ncbi:MAG TPA: hypothetical protein VG841_05025 [Caulobacterales bacterium]|nr:hypothetical protein [Caulobacterales bacterium]
MTKTISLPDQLVDEAAEAAQKAGESLEDFAARALSFELERERTEAFFAERKARANIARALELLNRPGGEPPQPGDELPEGYKPTR